MKNINGCSFDRTGDFVPFVLSPSFSHSSEKLLLKVRLKVLVPSISASVSMSVGDPVTLPCYRKISRKLSDDDLFVQWRRGGNLVLQLSTGVFSYSAEFRERASVSLDKIRQGDLSLTLRGTHESDSGVYQCYSDTNQTAISTSLEVKVPPQTISISVTGMSFSLRVPHLPVDVYFFREAKDKGVYTVLETSSNMTIEKVTLFTTPGPPQGLYALVLVASGCLTMMGTLVHAGVLRGCPAQRTEGLGQGVAWVFYLKGVSPEPPQRDKT
ncbi:hypothetical protein MATL_G00145150 [Megalops atlanticus]|uniref:Ig-like domain-containing protein n=1 Tax=Megalops atlanticus TaxID=7932 RepID=A0A9D3PWF9_MEGAT|nr:hypothetical protein MATL_G00145150 [Megalops atlanticus]